MKQRRVHYSAISSAVGNKKSSMLCSTVWSNSDSDRLPTLVYVLQCSSNLSCVTSLEASQKLLSIQFESQDFSSRTGNELSQHRWNDTSPHCTTKMAVGLSSFMRDESIRWLACGTFSSHECNVFSRKSTPHKMVCIMLKWVSEEACRTSLCCVYHNRVLPFRTAAEKGYVTRAPTTMWLS